MLTDKFHFSKNNANSLKIDFDYFALDKKKTIRTADHLPLANQNAVFHHTTKILTNQSKDKSSPSYFSFLHQGQSYNTFYTLEWRKIKCLNRPFHPKEKCNLINMLGFRILILRPKNICVKIPFSCFRMHL